MNFHLHICKSDIPFNLFYYGKGHVVWQREVSKKKNIKAMLTLLLHRQHLITGVQRIAKLPW